MELRKKQNFNEKVTLCGICLQQILVPSRVTYLDFHDKIDTWDLTYLHTDSQMFRVYHEEALVAVKELDENEINLETCENHAREVRCGMANTMQRFIKFKFKRYLLTHESGFWGLPNVQI